MGSRSRRSNHSIIRLRRIRLNRRAGLHARRMILQNPPRPPRLGKQACDGGQGGIFLFGRHGGRPCHFHDPPYRAGINPAPTNLFCKSLLFLSRPSRSSLMPCALCPGLHAPCPMLYAANGVSHNGPFVLYCPYDR
jgi:hypothetical protein